MKSRQLFFNGAILMIGLTSCNKQPDADFTTDKAEYIAGETIKLTNTSVDGVTYLWTTPDGQTATSQNLDFITNENSDDATLSFKLVAFSKKQKKDATMTHTVSLKAAYGDACFWQIIGSGFGNTTVSMAGQSGIITSEYGSDPGCGQAGNANFHLKVGNYQMTATDGNSTWSGTVAITKNGCISTRLQ